MARGGRARDVRRVAPECGLDERGLVGDLVEVLVGDGSVQEVVVEVVAPGAGHASGLSTQDVLDDLEVAGPAASLLTAQLDHAAGVGEHLGQRCHGRRDGVLTGRGERGGESAEGEVVEVAVCGRAVCAGDRREFGHGDQPLSQGALAASRHPSPRGGRGQDCALRNARYRLKASWLSGVKRHSSKAEPSSGSVSQPCQATSSGSGTTASGTTASCTPSQ